MSISNSGITVTAGTPPTNPYCPATAAQWFLDIINQATFVVTAGGGYYRQQANPGAPPSGGPYIWFQTNATGGLTGVFGWDSNLSQWTTFVFSASSIVPGPLFFGVDTGVANAYVVTSTPPATSLLAGTQISFVATHANGDASTLNAWTLGAKFIKRRDGSDIQTGDILFGQIVQLEYDGTNWQLLNTGSSSGTVGFGTIGTSVGLLIQPTAFAPTTGVDITADSVSLNSAGLSVVYNGVVIQNVTTGAGNGIGHLDVGTVAASTWYYIWVIGNGTTTPQGLISLSSTAPTLPAGYTAKALFGVFRTDGGSLIQAFYQIGKQISILPQLARNNAVGTNGAYASLDLTAFVPPIAKTVTGYAGRSDAHSADTVVSADANGLGQVICIAYFSGFTIQSYTSAIPFTVPVKTSQHVFVLDATNDAKYLMSLTQFTI